MADIPSPAGFPRFGDLPWELQQLIWRFASPPRVIMADGTRDPGEPPQRRVFTFFAEQRMALGACLDARDGYVTLSPMVGFFASPKSSVISFHPERDTLYLAMATAEFIMFTSAYPATKMVKSLAVDLVHGPLGKTQVERLLHHSQYPNATELLVVPDEVEDEEPLAWAVADYSQHVRSVPQLRRRPEAKLAPFNQRLRDRGTWADAEA